MIALAQVSASAKTLVAVVWTMIFAGVAGMVISFGYLASADYRDVVADAAGFVAGSLLIAGGFVSLAVLNLAPSRHAFRRPSNGLASVFPKLAVERWQTYFQRNREHRPEPNWRAPITLPANVVVPLVRSLEQFQLGDGGGPAYLVAMNRERFLASHRGTRCLVDAWFAEEREHARLLAAAVERFGGHRIESHWSFTAFCFVRRWLGVRFELTVLLLTEIVSTVYYRLLLRHGKDDSLRGMCRLILRDERGHVEFHRDRLLRDTSGSYGRMWQLRFRLFGLMAATVLWLSHSRGLAAIGATRSEFYRDVQREISRFIRRLRLAR